MNTQFKGSEAGAPAGEKTDATTKLDSSSSGSGEGQPSAPSKADPPAAGDKPDSGTQTAPDMGEVTRKAIEGSDVLSKLAGKKNDDTKGDQPTPKPGEKPVAKGTEKPAPGKPDAGNKDTKAPAYEPQDPKAKEAFAKMRTDLRSRDEEIAQLRKSPNVPAEIKELATFGEQINKALASVSDDFDIVTDEQLADVVSIRGAINRASHALENGQRPYATDVRTFEAAFRNLHELAVQLGVADEPTGASLPEPITGELPAKWKSLVEYGDLTEDEARLHAAVEAARGTRGRPAAKSRPAERQPAKREERTAEPKELPARSRQQSSTSSNQEQSPEEKLYKGRTRQFIIDAKVATDAKSAAEYWKTALVPIIMRELVAPAGGEDPVDHFLSLQPETRFKLAKEAHELHAARSKQSQSSPGDDSNTKGEKPKAPLFQRGFTTRRGLATPQEADDRKENSKQVLGFLAGKSAE